MLLSARYWRRLPHAPEFFQRRAGTDMGGRTAAGAGRGEPFTYGLCLKEVVMPLSSLREYLDKHGIKYIVISHSIAYTAQGIAALAHIPGKELAKTVIVKIDGKFAMAVVTASRQ